MSINVSKNQHEVSGLEFQINSLPRLDEWKNYSLSEITDPNRPISYGIVQTGPNIINGIPCLRVVDIVGGVIKTDNLIRTSASISESYRRTVLKSGDLVIPLRGKVGEIGYIDNDLAGANLTRGVALISVRPDFSSKYVKHFLSSKACADRFLASMNGSALQEITISTLRQFKVSLPSLPEQTAIANALSDVDALIQELEKLIAKKQAIKTATMQQLLTGRTRLPAFAYEKSAHHPDGRKKGYKPSELGEIPEDWEVKTIFELGRVSTGGTPSTSSAEYWNGDVPWITPTDISHSKNIYSSERKISQKGLQSIRPLPANTVLVTCIASIGKNAILRRDGACNQQINAVIPYDHIDVDFLFYAIELSSDRLKASAGITATLIVSKALFEEFQLVIPANLEEQEAISVILNEMDEDIQSLEKRLNKTRQIKRGMMQELLTGKTRLVKPAGAA
ncbi:restriction endonuclease subunit S [Shewanella sp. SM20]|uniref:restriction endonuclease subunit S n=1 Tax=Shewanella TaxID=22 RepID=UPI0021D918F0|nr:MULTISPECIES: restriction endonuclease subunit S [unclassified Shewanella]MCU8071375.1 restriction endonuclease subunit S [Shewanella sp. SM32]MCU8094201.1 restriction endonuclease subunit S [Shewanella sp. SM20]